MVVSQNKVVSLAYELRLTVKVERLSNQLTTTLH